MSATDPVRAAQDRIRAFNTARDWDQYHDPKNLVMLLASEVGELVAEFRWLTSEQSRTAMAVDDKRARIIAEVGDVGIALLSICDKLGVDLLTAIEAKLIANEQRYPVARSRGRPERPDPAR